MFTGLIQDVGILSRISKKSNGADVQISTSFKQLEMGESIAVNGVCLTVSAITGDMFTAFASSETLKRTSIGSAGISDKVNLERAVKVGDAMGGHIVSGHVDTQIQLLKKVSEGDAEKWFFTLPESEELKYQIASKGSVAIDGVSLTVNQVTADEFDVMLIPHTIMNTILHTKKTGCMLNLETDSIAKYVARQLRKPASTQTGVDMDFLLKNGFVR